MIMKVVVVIPAYNEEEVIEDTLKSLINQKLTPHSTILVNDGSTDNTYEIAKDYVDQIITIDKKEGNRLSSYGLAEVYNKGFEFIQTEIKNFDYLLVLDADTILPPDYLDKLTIFMKDNQIHFASGSIRNEESIVNVRGSGRLLSHKLFELMGGNYPNNYGFDSYPAHICSLYNLKSKVRSDLIYDVQRPTTQNYSFRSHIVNGRGFRAYGYLFPFAIKSFVITAFKIRSLDPIIYGIYGFLTLDEINYYSKHLRQAVKYKQIKLLISKIKFW